MKNWLNKFLKYNRKKKIESFRQALKAANTKNSLLTCLAMRVKTFILAKHIGQAASYFDAKLSSNEYIYLDRPDLLRGLHQVQIKIIKVGTWYERNLDELKEMHYVLRSYDHEGILMPDSWRPDNDILKRLDKLIYKAALLRDLYSFGDYHLEAYKIRDAYTQFGYIQKRRANYLYNKLKALEHQKKGINSIQLQILKIYDKVMSDRLTWPSDKINRETKFSNTGMDSMDGIEFVLAIEEQFDIEIPDEDAQNLETFGQAIRYISALISDENRNQNS